MNKLHTYPTQHTFQTCGEIICVFAKNGNPQTLIFNGLIWITPTHTHTHTNIYSLTQPRAPTTSPHTRTHAHTLTHLHTYTYLHTHTQRDTGICDSQPQWTIHTRTHAHTHTHTHTHKKKNAVTMKQNSAYSSPPS